MASGAKDACAREDDRLKDEEAQAAATPPIQIA
jgi:hypothetical protein